MMNKETEEVEEELTKAVVFTDPIETIFDINEQMLYRISRIRYVFTYAFWAGLIVSFVAGGAFVAVLLTDPDFSPLTALALVVMASAVAVWFSRQEHPFLDEYQVLAGAVNRAREWEPHPAIPDGNDVLERFVAYLKEQDERFGYFLDKKPEYLVRNARIKGKSRKEHHFDAFFEPSSFPWDDVLESVRAIIRVVPRVGPSEIKNMKDDVEDVLRALGRVRWVFKPGPTRAILLQAEKGDFSDSIIRTVNENWISYGRTLGGDTINWSSPIELVAEDQSGVYNFGSFYFG